MEREQDKAGDKDLAETWRSAEQPRSDDLAEWFGHFFEQRRRLRMIDADPRYGVVKRVLGLGTRR
ncbi:MAG TPA: hypothetical protein VI216_05060 [Candidatus Acidoferrales bacterium]|jgi:hypothetical protein|nr:hypothetical protein [Bradyrhizobium sp.]